jgi:integrase
MFNVAVGKTRKISTLEGTWLPPTHPNPIESVMLPQRKAKNHKPTRKELSAYLNALDAIPGGGALLFQALTMTRIAEAVNLCWSELDLEEGIWTLPASRAKNGQEHVVLLSPQAVSILEDRHKTTQGDFVFASPRNPKAAVTVNNVQHQLAKARPTIGLPDSFTSHSIRHAALTWAAENGCPRDVRDRLTNHVSGGGIDAIYNGASLNAPAKEWWKKWADHLDALKAPNVVPMAEAKA